MKKIEEIFGGFNTPKVSQGYMPAYENNFENYREDVKIFCELGVSHGASLIAWRKYFPNAQIVGIDNDPEPSERFPNFARKYLGDQADDISIEIGDATDKDFLEAVAEKYGGFDIVLDDCSHSGSQMQISFETLWKHSRFMYAVEDLQTQFSGNQRYIKDGNFIDYLQILVDEEITLEDIKHKTTFQINREDILYINFENFVAFMYPRKVV